MLSDSQRDLVRDKGTVLGRALIGLLFFVSGLSMLISGGAGWIASMFPYLGALSIVVGWGVILLKVVAGGAIIIGKRVGVASFSLIVFTALATLVAHSDFSDPEQITATLKNLAIIGALLYLMSYGPGGTNTNSLARSDSGESEA